MSHIVNGYSARYSRLHVLRGHADLFSTRADAARPVPACTATAQRLPSSPPSLAVPCTCSFSVALPMRDFPALERELSEISDPRNPRYGQWLSKEEADALTATPEDIKTEAYKWATSTGAECVKQVESLSCKGSVRSIEALLDTELHTFMHTVTGDKLIRTSNTKPGRVPTSLMGKVLMVTGLTQFPVPRLGSKRGMEVPRAQDTDYAVVPETLNIFYNVTSDDSAAASSVGPIEFQGYPAIVQTDLDGFATNTGLPKWQIPQSQIIGPFAPGAGAESALDEQYVYAMGSKNNQWYWTEADWLYEFGTDISNKPDSGMPKVFSISYAW